MAQPVNVSQEVTVPFPGVHWGAPHGLDGDLKKWTVEATRDQSLATFDMEYDRAFRNVRSLLGVFTEMGRPIKREDVILDFGCGEGKMVYAFRKLGYRAFGADIVAPSEESEKRIEAEGLSLPGEQPLRVIQSENYEIPFDTEYFDVVVSWEVMEHVQNHVEVLAEIDRVLKRGGRSLHFFPSRYSILEPHIGVPLGTVFQSYAYLYLWAALGVGNDSQKALTAKELARKNREFLRRETNYLTKKDLVNLADGSFRDIEFVERHFWKYNGGKGQLVCKTLSKLGLTILVPFVASLLSPLGHRGLFLAKP